MDVLPVRTADAVAAWLAAHPDIEIISRDRHGPYAKAVRRGAPQARQVANRFHLVLNFATRPVESGTDATPPPYDSFIHYTLPV